VNGPLGVVAEPASGLVGFDGGVAQPANSTASAAAARAMRVEHGLTDEHCSIVVGRRPRESGGPVTSETLGSRIRGNDGKVNRSEKG
jgi:hypothetical protein